MGEDGDFVCNKNSDENLFHYLQIIHSIPTLTPEDEKNLALKAQEGNLAARDEFVYANLRLVLFVVKDMHPNNLAKSDIIQEGVYALIKALNKYDPNEGRFSTFAVPTIRNHLRQYIARYDSLIRIPINSSRQYKNIQKAFSNNEDCQFQYSFDELSVKTGYTKKRIVNLYLASTPVDSLDRKIIGKDGKEGQLSDFLPSQTDIESEIAEKVLEEKVLEVMPQLPKKEQFVLKKYFGIGGCKDENLLWISRYLGVSKERVRQIKHEAYKHLCKLLDVRDSDKWK